MHGAPGAEAAAGWPAVFHRRTLHLRVPLRGDNRAATRREPCARTPCMRRAWAPTTLRMDSVSPRYTPRVLHACHKPYLPTHAHPPAQHVRADDVMTAWSRTYRERILQDATKRTSSMQSAWAPTTLQMDSPASTRTETQGTSVQSRKRSSSPRATARAGSAASTTTSGCETRIERERARGGGRVLERERVGGRGRDPDALLARRCSGGRSSARATVGGFPVRLRRRGMPRAAQRRNVSFQT